MIKAHNICLTLGGKAVFDSISFSFEQKQKIGLVGRNGSGKSTLLKVIAGQLALDEGALTIEKKKQIAYMPQEVVLLSNKTVLDEAVSVFDNIFALKNKRDELELLFEKNGHNNIPPEQVELYAHIQSELADVDLDAKIVEAKKVLEGLGFNEQARSKLVDQLSVGWKMRLVLAKLLLQKADFYLFDEPTNHLDIVAKDWFLEFLKNSPTGFLLVSHDRFFLDHLCSHIFELDRGNGKLYRGNYSSYREQKEQALADLESAYAAQQKEIQKKMELINKFKAKASKAGMAQSMLKQLDKMEKIEVQKKQRTMRLNFSDVKRTGEIVLKADNLSKSYDGSKIFEHISLEIKRGDKAAVVASNGKGKTTLLTLLTQNKELESGTIKFGHQVEWAFFEQDQEKSLNPANTILEEVENACKTSEARSQARSLLGAFLFPGDDVQKKIRVLSGGEKNRVAMVKVFLQKANFLILDEPTNHLDLESKEVLLEALKQFTGTILFVSHDRDFLDELASRVFELTADGIVSYEGNYESYLYQKSKQTEPESQEITKQPKVAAAPKPGKEPIKVPASLEGREAYEFRKKVQKIESKIEKLEAESVTLNNNLVTVTYGGDDYERLSQRLNEVKKQLESAMKEWEALQKVI